MVGHRFDPDSLVGHYEAIRREALAVAPDGRRGRGLVLFLRRGMAAWIEALSSLAVPKPAPEEDSSTLPLSLRPEIATILANMVLVCLREARR